MKELRINTTYPRNEYYDLQTKLVMLDLDKEREHDLLADNGFVISPFAGIKKDLKDPNGIFSSKFGQSLKDMNPENDRYRCECGARRHKVRLGTKCPLCGTEVKYVDDNFSYFGWKILKYDKIIHPNIYRMIESFMGKQILENIINYERNTDVDGHNLPFQPINDGEPYSGLGMTGFVNEFDEIMDYYLRKKPNKKDLYDTIKLFGKNTIFTSSIPVYTTLLRPFDIDGKSLYHEESNTKYNMINKHASVLNKTELGLETNEQSREATLKKLQDEYNKLYDYIIEICSGKKGEIRQLFSGRYNFSGRCVITGDSSLRTDQIKLPYKCLISWLDPQIKNILVKSYNMSYNDADEFLFKASIEPNDTVANIILSIIHNTKEGLPVVINRNPSILFGSLLQMFCVGISDDYENAYTLTIPLQIIRLEAADFDGDTNNVLYVINDEFFKALYHVFNPRNNMHISKNDGRFEDATSHQRDTIVNLNTMFKLGRKYETPEERKKKMMLLQHKHQLIMNEQI